MIYIVELSFEHHAPYAAITAGLKAGVMMDALNILPGRIGNRSIQTLQYLTSRSLRP